MNKNKQHWSVKTASLLLSLSLIGCGEQNHPSQSNTSSEPQLDAQVVDGSAVPPHKYPFMVQYEVCGGAIINRLWILTAKHCNKNSERTITAGAADLNRPKGTEQYREMVQFFDHPTQDLRLAKLDRPLEFNQYVQPISFGGVPRLGAHYTVAGWGMMHPSGKEGEKPKPSIPREYTGTMVSPAICGADTTKGEFCVKGNSSGGNKPQACHGDSGSAIFNRSTNPKYPNRYYFYGVVTGQARTSPGSDECADGFNIYTALDYRWFHNILTNN